MSSRPRPRLIAFVVAFAFLMQTIDSSIINTALPEIAVSFGESPVRLSIVITLYVLTMAAVMPVSGWLADRFGARRIFILAVATYTVGALASSMSGSLIELIAARILQASGSAMVLPVGRQLVVRAAPKAELVRTLTIQTMISQTGPLFGPIVGGFIVTYVSWRWNFLISVPIGILAIVLALIFIEEYRAPERRPLDWSGLVMTTAALTAVLYGIEAIGRRPSDPVAMGLIVVGLVIGAAAVRHFRRTPFPLLDLSLLRFQTFRVNLDAGSLFRICSGGQAFLMPLLFQVVFGMSAFVSGLLVFAVALGAIVLNRTVPFFLRTLGYRRILSVNCVASAAIFVSYMFFTADTPHWVIITLLFLSGFTQSLELTGLMTLGFADLGPDQITSGSTFSQVAQQLTRGAGASIVALVLSLSLFARGGEHVAQVDFNVGFAVMAGLLLLSLITLLALPKDAGASLSGHKSK